MTVSERFLSLFKGLCYFNFGDFETEEFKKFCRMGVIFALIIGCYWTMRPLKDAVFIQLVDSLQLPFAKTASVLALLPLLIAYTRLLHKISFRRMFVFLAKFYSVSILCFSVLLYLTQAPASEIAIRPLPYLIATRALGYLWYIFVESFGSLVVALFWSIAADMTDPSSARRGFPLVVAMGQLGGVIFPYSVGGLGHRFHLSSDCLALVCLSLLSLLMVPLFRSFITKTPEHLLQPFDKQEEKIKIEEPGFFEGLKLILKHRYLLAIFGANFIYEVVITIFDFNFKLAASNEYSGVDLSHYLSFYASSVNIVSLLCLLLGISNVTRFLGVNIALAAMPVIVGIALSGFLVNESLSFLFALMVGSKAINYALNGPALKLLYIPTTSEIRSKSQAWIETFGSRTSKEAGSIFNMLLSPLQSSFGSMVGRSYYLTLSGLVGFPLLVLWFFLALFLGKAYFKAVHTNKVIC